ncbi:glycosyltransferase family 4 protein [Yinghuangia seranimata]|uniref:glycosyltransferase family 4 protein n=1 Tax=Yinghuangia seranimata TaxID=408067 RepID=UPI00248BE2FA|nr:glycosyltransferase family 4 protein [Yinghuangia seranimata]MDI2131714.1 glycosyltransferase family 4 protein [Yinghuangia seranimata]
MKTTHARDIFIVCNSVDELGGLTRWADHIARLFVASGHRVELIGITPATTRAGYRDVPYRTRTLYTEHPPPGWRPRRPWQHANVKARIRQHRRDTGMRAAADQLSEVFRAAPSDAVIIVAQVWAMEWVALADTAGLPVVAMSHESYEASRASSRYGRVKRYYSRADRLLLLTHEDADAWAVDHMTNVGYMPNPLPLVVDEPADGTEKTVVSLGRLSYEKGYDLLLEAWADVAPKHPDWTLRLHGTGDEEAALRAQAETLGIAGSVDFAGQTSDIEGALKKASVFALASRAEGFPLSLLEAMACGLPCVAFDCAPGVREIIRDGTDGLLAVTGNTRQFADQLDRLLGDPELRATLGARARKDAERFSPDAVLARWEHVFQLVHR